MTRQKRSGKEIDAGSPLFERAIDRGLRYTSTIGKFVAIAGGACIVLMAVLIVYGVIARNVLKQPVGGLEEVAGFLTVPAVFLPLAYTLETGGHIRTELFIGRISSRTRHHVEVVTRVLALLFTTVLAYALFERTQELHTTGSRSSGGALLLWVPGATMVVGTGLLWLRLGVEILAGLVGVELTDSSELGVQEARVPDRSNADVS